MTSQSKQAVQRLRAALVDRDERDVLIIVRAAKRLLRLKSKYGSLMGIERATGVNHGNVSALILHGRVPRDAGLRTALGLPRHLPSERRHRPPRVIPPLGSPAWLELAFKKIKPQR